MKKLSSLTIFFPFFNDEGTVERQINDAYNFGRQVARKLHVIALHGGQSHDQTLAKIKKMKRKYVTLKIINKIRNWEGYAVIKYGLADLPTDWVFYTDGDAQYHLQKDLAKMVLTQIRTKADVVNGYKTKRQDDFIRIFLGKSYAFLCRFIFKLPIRDIDCDFRLIRTSILKKICLKSHDSTILPELIKKLQFAGAKFVEIPVTHYPRQYGKSNYQLLKLIKDKIVSGSRLYFQLMVVRKR